jgi:tRNA-2-methylthio-N6-dimethylallyladenosine synthase
MEEVGYDFAFMFKYSERPGTFAQRNMPDNIPEDLKTARLTEIINLQNKLSEQSNKRDVGKEFEILVEGTSKRREDQIFGRTSQNKVVIIDRRDHKVGDYVKVRVTGCSSATLFGEEIE